MKCVVATPLVALLLTLGPALDSQNARPPHRLARHWTETGTETLWTTRYSNCDYGYYVLLDSGVVGHGTHSPNPNHGFLVPLPDVGRTSEASDDEARFVFVDASYDVWEDTSLAGAVTEQEHIMMEIRSQSRVDERKHTKLSGLRAIRSTVESSSPKGAVVDEAIVAVRSGIVYTIGLHTTQQFRTVDEEQFKMILSGFRLLKLPQGECSNG